MGHRGSFAVIKDGRAQLYHSQWGGIRVVQAFFFGPEFGLDYCRSLRPVEGLLDDVYCEGAALLDLDEKRLAFFQSDMRYHSELRRYLLTLMKATWPGWDVHWAGGGIVEIASRLGFDPGSVRCIEDGDVYEEPPDWDVSPEWIGSILSVQNHGVVLDFCFENNVISPLMVGPDLFGILENRVPSTWTLSDLDELEGGANLDPESKEIAVWFLTGADNERVERLRRRWPGWTIVRHDGGLPGQLRRSGRDPAIGSVGEDEAIRQIVALLFEDDSFDPAQVLEHFKAQGQEVQQVAPGFLQVDRPCGEASSKMAIFERALAEFREGRLR